MHRIIYPKSAKTRLWERILEFKIVILNLLRDMIVQLYVRNKSYEKCHFKQHLSPLSTFQDVSFSPQESSKNFKSNADI